MIGRARRWLLVRSADGNATGSSRVFRLRIAPDGFPLPDFRPGQRAALSFPGRGVLAVPRSYPIASPPSEGRFLEFYVEDVDAWTFAAKAAAAEADGALLEGAAPPRIDVRIGKPRGGFAPECGGGRRAFLASGLGGVPFVCALRAAAARGLDGGPPAVLVWEAPSRDLLPGFGALAAEPGIGRAARVVPVLERDPLWTGARGRLDGAALDRLVPAAFGGGLDFDWASAEYWICCPPRTAKLLRAALRSRGARAASIRVGEFPAYYRIGGSAWRRDRTI